MLGKLYHIRQETVERYATYAKAIDIVRAAVPELAEGLLFGRLWLTVDRIMELPYKTPEELQKLNVLLRSGIDPPGGGSAWIRYSPQEFGNPRSLMYRKFLSRICPATIRMRRLPVLR